MLEENNIEMIESLDMTQLLVIIEEKKEELFDIRYSCHIEKCTTEEDKKKIEQIVNFIHHCYERLHSLSDDCLGISTMKIYLFKS